jgi:hypothetical protein
MQSFVYQNIAISILSPIFMSQTSKTDKNDKADNQQLYFFWKRFVVHKTEQKNHIALILESFALISCNVG